jgi:hypothetical protein
MKDNNFVFIVFAGEPFLSLGVSKVDLPVPVTVATAVSKAVASGQDVPLDLPTIRDFVMVCCREYPKLASRCLPAKCCLAFLFGRQALDACSRMFDSGDDLNDDRVVTTYNTRLNAAFEELSLACGSIQDWEGAPQHLKYNCHWYMARAHMLAHSEERAICELEQVITLCGASDLVPDVWLALAGILFTRKESNRGLAILIDYVHRAKTLFPDRTIEFLAHGRNSRFSVQYPDVRQYFENLNT